jgi:hypothetical protein
VGDYASVSRHSLRPWHTPNIRIFDKGPSRWLVYVELIVLSLKCVVDVEAVNVEAQVSCFTQ